MRVGVSKMAHAGSVEKDVRPRAEVPVTSLSAALRGCDKLLQLPSRPAVPPPRQPSANVLTPWFTEETVGTSKL